LRYTSFPRGLRLRHDGPTFTLIMIASSSVHQLFRDRPSNGIRCAGRRSYGLAISTDERLQIQNAYSAADSPSQHTKVYLCDNSTIFLVVVKQLFLPTTFGQLSYVGHAY
jgi:hypothetical protein